MLKFLQNLTLIINCLRKGRTKNIKKNYLQLLSICMDFSDLYVLLKLTYSCRTQISSTDTVVMKT